MDKTVMPDGCRIDLQIDTELNQAVRRTVLTRPETSWITPELDETG
jgi:hypothetical protein